jgi:hypothetical protein
MYVIFWIFKLIYNFLETLISMAVFCLSHEYYFTGTQHETEWCTEILLGDLIFIFRCKEAEVSNTCDIVRNLFGDAHKYSHL